MKLPLLFAWVSSFTFAVPSSRPAEDKAKPEDVVRSLVAAIRALERAGAGQSLTAVQKTKNRDIAQRAHRVLDFEGLARQSLGDHWKKLEPAERTAFLTLLKRLFEEVAYPQSAKFFGKLELEFEDAGLRRGQHVIEVAVTHPDEGLVDLEFKLGVVGGRWKVQDMSLDGISLGRDIQSQMQKIVRKDGYPELVRRMETKLKDDGMDAKTR